MADQQWIHCPGCAERGHPLPPRLPLVVGERCTGCGFVIERIATPSPVEAQREPPCSVALNCREGDDLDWLDVTEADTGIKTSFCPRHSLCAELLTTVLGHRGRECPELIRLVERGRA